MREYICNSCGNHFERNKTSEHIYCKKCKSLDLSLGAIIRYEALFDMLKINKLYCTYEDDKIVKIKYKSKKEDYVEYTLPKYYYNNEGTKEHFIFSNYEEAKMYLVKKLTKELEKNMLCFIMKKENECDKIGI